MTTQAQQTKENAGWPALVRSAEADDVTTVTELLASGCDVNQRDSDGMTALMLAAATGQIEIISLLLARGASIDLAREDGLTALAVAAFFGRHQVVRELIVRGANVAAIGRFRRTLETWADTHGFVPESQPTLETEPPPVADLMEEPPSEVFAIEDTEEEESRTHPEPEPIPVLNSLVEGSEAQPSKPIDSGYESDWFAISTALSEAEVSPARVWTTDFEDLPDEEVEERVTVESDARADTSGSFALPSARLDDIDVSAASVWATDYEEFGDRRVESSVPAEFTEPSIEPAENSEEDYFVGVAPEPDFQPRDEWEAVGESAPSVMDDDDEVTIQTPLSHEPDTVPIEVLPADEHDDWAAPPRDVVAAEITATKRWPVAQPERLEVPKRPLVLDETGVLPSEASFATVALNQGAFSHPYSPRLEFMTKLSNWRRIGVPALLMISLGIAATWLEIRYATARNLINSLNDADATAAAPQKATVIRLRSEPRADRKPVTPIESGSAIETKPSITQPLSPTLNPKPAVTTNPSTVANWPAASTSHVVVPRTAKAKSTTSKSAAADRHSPAGSSFPANARVQTQTPATSNTARGTDAKPAAPSSDGSVRPRRVGNKDLTQSRPNP